MSNKVEIKYNKSGKYPEILINDEAISRFMSLSNYIYDDIFNWSDYFFEIMDSELEEAYEVILTGHPYQYTVIKDASKKSRHCKKVSFLEIERKISVKDKFLFVKNLHDEYNLFENDIQEQIEFNSNISDESEEKYFLEQNGVIFSDDKSDYYITYNGEFDISSGYKYFINVCDTNSAKKVRGSSFVNVSKHDLKMFIDYLYEYHLYLNTVIDCANVITKHNLSKNTKLEYDAYYNEEYRVSVYDVPNIIDFEEAFEIKYEYYPKCFEDPCLVVSSSNTNIKAENLTITGINKGSSEITVVDKFGTVHLKKVVEVLKHNYVRSINIILPQTSMVVGETIIFKSIATPLDAEDIDSIKYEVNNESLAVVSNKNELYALASGRVCLKVYTPRVCTKVYIEILGKPESIAVSSENLELQTRSEVTVFSEVLPLNIKEKPVLTWTTNNARVIDIRKSDSKKCVFVTKEPGTAYITVSMQGHNISKKIKVTVSKPKGCYVATSVYGSYDCPEVWVLRRFRDNCLDKHWYGRLFIKMYYAISPTVVKLFGKTKIFSKTWKFILDKMVKKLQNKGYEETPYNDKY